MSIEYNVMHVVWVQEGDECKEVEQLAFKSWVSLRQARDRYFRFSALEMCQAYLVERDVAAPAARRRLSSASCLQIVRTGAPPLRIGPARCSPRSGATEPSRCIGR